MAIFRYKALTNDGKASTGLVEAPSEDQAAKILKEKQLFVVSLAASSNTAVAETMSKFRKVGFGEVVNFTRQLSTMVVAGLTLPECLRILRTQTTNPLFAKNLEAIEHHITSGGNLADALAKYPDLFSQIYIALVRAGEASGMLDKVLVRLADTLEAEREFRGKVIGALIYPAIIVVGMIVVVIIMMIVVMPKLSDLYRDFNLSLPMTTQILISISNFTVKFWWLVLALVVGGVFGFRAWRKTESGEFITDAILLKLPVFGNLQKKVILVEFTRTLSMLISSGIHILDALRILKNSMGNVLYRNDVDEIAKKIEKGFPIGDSFAQYKEFPPVVSQMMKVGEETGKLDDTLLKLSVYFQVESEAMIKGLTTAIEPIIMVILGVGVGFIVISVITPIYNLTAQFK